MMKKLIKKFWQSEDRWYWIVLSICTVYIIYQIIGGILS